MNGGGNLRDVHLKAEAEDVFYLPGVAAQRVKVQLWNQFAHDPDITNQDQQWREKVCKDQSLEPEPLPQERDCEYGPGDNA